jgi:uncharacterized protein YdhG (YjbR/CyaY superfamily)
MLIQMNKMKATSTKFKTVDEYLSALPENAKAILKEFRKTIKQAAPQAEELISYNMPAFTLHGGLIWYAAWKEHISLYPRTARMEASIKELSEYEGSKGTIKFPMDKPLPFSLITKIVKFRVKENLEKAKVKRK